jgi:peptide deformylase
MKLIKYPHPTLRKKAKLIKKITPEIKKFSKELLQTLVPKSGKNLGVGLAANQVNSLHRIFVVLMPDKKYQVCLNPQIIKTSNKTLSSLSKKKQFLEGCLCFPGYYGFVDRPAKIKVKYLTPQGLEKKASLAQPYSSYFAHELDHLNGVLFIDHITEHQQLYLANESGQLEPVDNPFK